MPINELLFTCARCSITTLAYATPEKLSGDWIVRCPECGAKNLVENVSIYRVEVPTAQIMGWQD